MLFWSRLFKYSLSFSYANALWANALVQSQRLDTQDANALAINAAVGLRANISSPTLTGNPRAPTVSAGDRSTSLATTAFVMTQDDTQRVYIDNSVNSNISALSTSLTANIIIKANIDSPTLTGTPTAPTPSIGDRSTTLATTAFVMTQDDTRRVYVDTQIAANITTLNTAVNNNLALKAPILNAELTGAPTAPTASPSTNTTQIATTAFVRGEISGVNSLWQGSHRFISTQIPDSNQGIDGDFWFQYM